MYYLDAARNELWDKVTLKNYRLNNDAKTLLVNLIENPSVVKQEDKNKIFSILNDLNINFDDINILHDGSPTLKTPIIHIIKNCNSRCIMCDCWKEDKNSYIKRSDLLPLWRKLKSNGAYSIMLSGGEPTLHPELKDIISDIHESGLYIELNTNGILLNELEYLSSMHIDNLIVSLDGFNERDYKLLRGCSCFNRVITNVENFIKKSSETLVGFRVTLTKYSLSHLKELVSLSKEIGVDAIGFSPLDIDSNSFNRCMDKKRSDKLRSLLVPTMSDVDAMLNDLSNSGEFYQIISQAHKEGLFAWGVKDFERCLKFYKSLLTCGESLTRYQKSFEPCTFPMVSLVLDYDASIKPCFYGDSVVGLHDIESFKWSPLLMLEKMQDSKRCSGCRGKVFCGR